LLYCKLLQRAALISQGHLFGLPGSEQDPTSGFRMMCLSIIHSKDLRDAINRAVSFYDLYARTEWRFSMQESGDQALLRFHVETAEPSLPFKIVHYMSLLCRFWAWMSGQYIELASVNFRGCPNYSLAKYFKLFECDLEFNCEENAIRFDRRYLDHPIVQTEDSLEKFLETVPYQLMTMPRDDSDTVASKIRFIIGNDFTREIPSLETITDLLHTSATSLRRKLKKEGTTYQQIKDRVRREAAIEYLSRPDLTINASALLMGFDDPSAFSRSFKKWTGLSPGVYRNRYLLGGESSH
jgi:AraC-like DNA-binding protein